MNKQPAAAQINSVGSVVVYDTTGGIITQIGATYGKPLSVNITGMNVTVQTDQKYTVIYEIINGSGYRIVKAIS